MHDIEEIITALPCLTSTQRQCLGCPYNPHPGMKWPYGCIKGQNDIIDETISILREKGKENG